MPGSILCLHEWSQPITVILLDNSYECPHQLKLGIIRWLAHGYTAGKGLSQGLNSGSCHSPCCYHCSHLLFLSSSFFSSQVSISSVSSYPGDQLVFKRWAKSLSLFPILSLSSMVIIICLAEAFLQQVVDEQRWTGGSQARASCCVQNQAISQLSLGSILCLPHWMRLSTVLLIQKYSFLLSLSAGKLYYILELVLDITFLWTITHG